MNAPSKVLSKGGKSPSMLGKLSKKKTRMKFGRTFQTLKQDMTVEGYVINILCTY